MSIVAKVVAVLMFAAAGVAPAQPARSSLPPCPTEDSDNCRWDASSRGEGAGRGQGRSFVNINGRVAYLD